MTKKSKLSFEEALTGLEQAADALKQNDGTLEDAMKQYETGAKYYDTCMELLLEAKQQIELYDKELGETRDF